MHTRLLSILITHLKDLNFFSKLLITSSMDHSDSWWSLAICYFISDGSFFSTEVVDKGPYDSEDLPNEDNALMCCSSVS